MTGFCKYKTCFEKDKFLALMEEFKRCTFSENMVGDISVDLLSVLQRLGRALVRTQAGLGRRTTARPGDLTRLKMHYVEVSKQRVMAVFDQIDI